MKNVIKIILIIIILNQIVIANKKVDTSDGQGIVIRNLSWNMTRLQVKAIEAKDITSRFLSYDRNENTLYYRSIILNKNINLIHYFNDNSLYMITYGFNNSNMKIYSELKETLNNEYGNPVEDTMIWYGGACIEEYYPDRMQAALMAGYLMMKVTWRTANTSIYLIYYGNEVKVKYIDKNYEWDLRDQKKKNNKEELSKF